MSQVIDFPDKGGRPPDNVISVSPMRLRWGDWATSRIIQVHVQPAAAYEHQREEDFAAGRQLGATMPTHFSLDGPLHDSALGLMRHRNSRENQVDVVYLSALMEILTNVPCAILRTDLIRRVYREVESLSQRLAHRWHSRRGSFVLPINADAQNPQSLAQSVAAIDNLKTFFEVTRDFAEKRHAILARDYVIYFPRPAKGL